MLRRIKEPGPDTSLEAGGWPELDVELLGAKLGRLGSPDPSAETKIVRAALKESAELHLHDLEDYCSRQRSAYLDRMKVRDVRPEIEGGLAESLNELASLKEQDGAELAALRRECTARLGDYERYRKENDIGHEPHYPESKLRHALIAVLAAIAETALNGSLLAIGAQGGLLQGWSVAAGIALINVGGAFCVGNAARLVNARSWSSKSLGFASIFFGAVILVLFNLLVAHYREALLSSEGYNQVMDAGRRAWDAFSADYFGVSDFMSWMLFGMGMMSAGLGAWKGYTSEDPYPGYSRRARALAKSQEEYQGQYEDAVEAVTELQNDGIRGIDAYVSQYRTALSNAETMLSRLRELDAKHRSERRKAHSKIEYVQAVHCPEEEPVVVPEAPAADAPPVEEHLDPEVVAEFARVSRDKLAQQCGEVLAAYKGSQRGL